MQHLIRRGAVAALVLAFVCSCTGPTSVVNLPVFAKNVVSLEGEVSANATWRADKVYYIGAELRVKSGATLTIQAGTVVKLGPEGRLIADGGLIVANGTPQLRIVFTSYRDSLGGDSILNDAAVLPASGDWRSILIETSSTGNVFTYCDFCYAGIAKEPALRLDGSAQVDHCRFYDNAGALPSSEKGAALDARTTLPTTTITNNLFYNNIWPLAVPADYTLDDSNSFEFDHDNDATTASLKNTHQGVFVYVRCPLVGQYSWKEKDVALCVFETGRLQIGSSPLPGSLSVDSGVVVKFNAPDGGIWIDEASSTLSAQGAFFTSYKDDSLLGDSNADGGASSPGANDWAGIYDDNADSFLPADSDPHITYASNTLT